VSSAWVTNSTGQRVCVFLRHITHVAASPVYEDQVHIHLTCGNSIIVMSDIEDVVKELDS